MTIKLTSHNYWQELEFMDLPLAAKDQLKAMVSAHLSGVIPPLSTPHILRELAKVGIEFVKLSDSASDQWLEVAEFVPDDPEKHRSFTFLRKAYPCGETRKIAATPLDEHYPRPWGVDSFPHGSPKFSSAVLYAADSTRICQTTGTHAEALACQIASAVNGRTTGVRACPVSELKKD